MRQNQREVIRVDPDDAELRVVGVVSGHVFQDLQELVAVWGRQSRENLSSASRKKGNNCRIQGGKGKDLDLPPLQTQQYVSHPCRPPRNLRDYSPFYNPASSTQLFLQTKQSTTHPCFKHILCPQLPQSSPAKTAFLLNAEPGINSVQLTRKYMYVYIYI